MDTTRATLAPTHLDVLYLLVIGAQRLAIARDLHLSARTVDQRIADLKYALRTPDRFGLGVGAIRRRWIDPTYPITHAAARRERASWVEPSHRQHEILRLRAAGVTVFEVAGQINVSTSCIRRELSQLAADNGARSGISAGALFEALGWTRLRNPDLAEHRP